MRDKIIIKEKYAIKIAKRPLVQKEKEKGETIEKIQLETEV
jgi:hypothetical protein